MSRKILGKTISMWTTPSNHLLQQNWARHLSSCALTLGTDSFYRLVKTSIYLFFRELALSNRAMYVFQYFIDVFASGFFLCLDRKVKLQGFPKDSDARARFTLSLLVHLLKEFVWHGNIDDPGHVHCASFVKTLSTLNLGLN